MARLGDVSYDEDNFDRNKSGYVPLPDGTYNVEIVGAEQKRWDDGGVQLGLSYKVIDGPYADKIIFDNLQLVHKSNDVQGIARAALHKICDNLGVAWPLADDELLLGGCMTIVLKTRKKEGKEYQNVAGRDPLATGRVRQENTASQATMTGGAKNGAQKAQSADAPW